MVKARSERLDGALRTHCGDCSMQYDVMGFGCREHTPQNERHARIHAVTAAFLTRTGVDVG